MNRYTRMREEKPYFVKNINNLENAKKYLNACIHNAKKPLFGRVVASKVNNGYDVELYNYYYFEN